MPPGLPDVWFVVAAAGAAALVVESLVINETAPYKLFAFTHGRGAWMTNLNTNAAAPAAATTTQTSGRPGGTK